MAPGACKLKSKTIPNKSQQSVIDHTTKDASSNSTPRRSIRRIFDRTNVAANEALVRTEMQNGSFERGETTTTNHTNESDNTGNRKQVRAPHISGRTPFTVLQYEISQKELNGEECDMIELYKRTHYKEKDGWSRVEAQENWELMISKRAQYTEEGIEKSVDEIVLEVLGHGSGYRKGLGYGPKPPSRRATSHDSSTQQLQNKLQETQEKLQESESQVSGFKSQVGDLKDQLSQQGACIEKLMAFMAASGNTL